MEEVQKFNIRRRWLYSLFEFAHLEFQKKLWIEASYQDIIGNYSECITGYFNDLSIEEGYEKFINEDVISREELTIISDFHNQLDDYICRTEKQTLSDKKILKDIEWVNLTNLANINWKKLKSIVKQGDLNYMTELENTYL